MTYNFDPERWYDNERAALELELKTGKINEKQYKKALADIEQRYDDMIDRLDGTYQVPE